MKLSTEDFLGKAILLVAFSLLGSLKVLGISLAVQHQGPGWEFDFVAGAAGLTFQILIIVLTLIRLPAKDAAAGWEPRMSAIAGSFLMLCVIALPPSTLSVDWKMLAAVVSTIGVLLSLYCVWWLGRSFSVMATARKLVTAGPYSIVRHPLYASETVALLGMVIANFSLGALALGLVALAFQFRRMVNEEGVLSAALPEYKAYAARVPFIFPRLRVRAETAA